LLWLNADYPYSDSCTAHETKTAFIPLVSLRLVLCCAVLRCTPSMKGVPLQQPRYAECCKRCNLNIICKVTTACPPFAARCSIRKLLQL